MKTLERARSYPPLIHPTPDEKHLMDYVRVVYKRRWIALPVFLIVFVVGAVNALREMPIYQARVQMLIQKDAPNVARLDQVFQAENSWYDSDFYSDAVPDSAESHAREANDRVHESLDRAEAWKRPGPEAGHQLHRLFLARRL